MSGSGRLFHIVVIGVQAYAACAIGERLCASATSSPLTHEIAQSARLSDVRLVTAMCFLSGVFDQGHQGLLFFFSRMISDKATR